MILKRGKVFWLDLRVAGKRIRRSLRTTEQALALERARDVAHDLRENRPKGALYVDFCQTYYEYSRTSKPASYRDEKYRGEILSAYFKDRGLLTLEQITTQEVEKMRAWLLTRPIGKKTKRTMSRATVNRYLAQLRVMFNKAADWGTFQGTNPVSKVRFFREGEKVRPLSEAEIRRVLEAAEAIGKDKYAYPTSRAIFDICRVVLNTGLRRSEALNLRWSDIIDDELRVRGKGGKVRMIPINDETALILKQRPRLTAYVFDIPNRNASGVMRRVTETISKRAGVHFWLHSLRHAFASRLLAAGVDVVTIGDLLGHSAAMTTMLYAHSNPELKKRAISRLRPDLPLPAPPAGEA